MQCALESRELLALCLKKLKASMAKVGNSQNHNHHHIDCSWCWVHSVFLWSPSRWDSSMLASYGRSPTLKESRWRWPSRKRYCGWFLDRDDSRAVFQWVWCVCRSWMEPFCSRCSSWSLSSCIRCVRIAIGWRPKTSGKQSCKSDRRYTQETHA